MLEKDDGMNSRPCKYCGRMLYFTKDHNDKIIPLEAVEKPYIRQLGPAGFVAVRADPSEPVFQSHFDRCLKKEEKKG